jgi:hypothetical protein
MNGYLYKMMLGRLLSHEAGQIVRGDNLQHRTPANVLLYIKNVRRRWGKSGGPRGFNFISASTPRSSQRPGGRWWFFRHRFRHYGFAPHERAADMAPADGQEPASCLDTRFITPSLAGVFSLRNDPALGASARSAVADLMWTDIAADALQSSMNEDEEEV